MAKTRRKGGPDLLALAMRRARQDVAEGKVPRRPPEAEEGDAAETAEEERASD